MASFPEDLDFGSLVPLDPLYNMDKVAVTSNEFKEYIRQLQRVLYDMSVAINTRDSSYYPTIEFINGQLYFPDPALSPLTSDQPRYRSVFRKVIDFGQLPNTTTKSVAHDLSPTSDWSFTRIYGTASDTTGLTYIPLPYAHPTSSNNIAINVDNTNVTITTGSDRTAYHTCYVVVEYLKN